MSGELRIPESALWDLVDQWRKAAEEQPPMPFLSSKPHTAYGQGMNEAAEDLSDLILEIEDQAGESM